MYASVCVSIHVCLFTCSKLYACVCMCMDLHTRIHMCLYVHVHLQCPICNARLHAQACTHVYSCTQMFTYMCEACSFMCVCLCAYVCSVAEQGQLGVGLGGSHSSPSAVGGHETILGVEFLLSYPSHCS